MIGMSGRVNKAASLLGKRSAEVRLQKWGKEEFARKLRSWGKLGGRPKGSGKKAKGGRPWLPDNQVSKAALYQRARRERLRKEAPKGSQRKGR